MDMLGLLNFSKLSYSFLNKELLPKLNKDLDNIVFIVDLKSLIRKIFSFDYDFIDTNYSAMITSDFINIPAYYRNYLISSGYKNVKIIYLYSSSKCSTLMNIYPDYKKHHYEKYFDNEKIFSVISLSIKLLKTLCKYLPDTQYFDTSDLDEFIWADIIVKNNKKNKNVIIFSNDYAVYQALSTNSLGIYTNRKKSSIITPSNIMNKISGVKTRLSVNLLPLYLSMNPDVIKSYSLNKVKKCGNLNTLKEIQNLVSNNLLYDTKYLSFPEDSIKYSKLIKNNEKNIRLNYSVIFPVSIEMRNRSVIIPKINEEKVFKDYRTQFDELNSQYFVGCPLNIDEIYKGRK